MNRAALLQNLLGSDQLKYSCLTQITDCLWENMKVRLRPYPDSGYHEDSPQHILFYQTEFYSCALTSNNNKHVLQVFVTEGKTSCPRTIQGNKMHSKRKDPCLFPRVSLTVPQGIFTMRYPFGTFQRDPFCHLISTYPYF